MGDNGQVRLRVRNKGLRRVRVADLEDAPWNFRTHPPMQRGALEGAINELGYYGYPDVYETAGGTLRLTDGHLRKDLLIAKYGPDTEIEVNVTDFDDDDAKKAILTKDPLAAMAEADTAKLDELLRQVQTGDENLAAMLEQLAEAHGILDGLAQSDIVEDEVPEPQAVVVTKPGDLWILGEHRLLCADCRESAAWERLLGGELAALCHADPPYGMGKESDGIVNDNLYGDKLDAFQMSWWRAVRMHLESNASAYIWGNAEDLWRLWYRGGLVDSERRTLRNEIVWAKGGGGQNVGTEGGRMYFTGSERCIFFMLGEQGFNNNADNYWEGWEEIRSKLKADCDKMGWGPKDIERICGVGMYSHWFTKSQWVFIPEEHYRKLQAASWEHDAFKREHDELKREFYATRAYFDNTHDNMTDVWSFSRVTGMERHGHATPKPVAMIARIVASSLPKNGLCLEPFVGSGTTIMACEALSRRCFACEIEPRYVDVSVRRWQNLTGRQAILESTGQPFPSN